MCQPCADYAVFPPFRIILQVKGSGIANTCPVIEGGSTNLKDLKAGTYK